MNRHTNVRGGIRSLARPTMWIIAGLTVLRVWFAVTPSLPTARAQIPDAGEQRILLLKEARHTNQLLSDIKAILRTATLNVRVKGADN